MRHFAHNIGDYAAATAHLPFVEDAAYSRLLRRYYQDEKPLPGNLDACVRLAGARTKEERQAVANVLAEFFTLEADGYHQSRADREIAVYQSKVNTARENGTKGGRPVNREKTQPVSSRMRSERDLAEKNDFANRSRRNDESTQPRGEGNENKDIENRRATDGVTGANLSRKATTPHSPLPIDVTTAVTVGKGTHTTDGDPPDHPGFEEPDAPEPVPKFLAQHGVVAPRAQTISQDWVPSESAQHELVKSRPDLTPERIQQEMLAFRRWCAAKNITTHNPDASWLKFMEKADVKRLGKDDEWSSPATRGIDAAFARRSISTK